MLEADNKSVKVCIHKCIRLTLYVLQADLEEAVKSIYMIQNSVCATDGLDIDIPIQDVSRTC